MGLFSRIFGGKKSSGVVSGRNPGSAWTAANRFNKAKGGYAGGYGAITFGNIMNAHCSPDDIVSEFGLDTEECNYKHPYLGATPWMYAYREALAEAQSEAMAMAALGIDVDAEDLIDWSEVEESAYDYAIELAEMYIRGETWIPSEILDWAYYDISDHNG